jgi:recombination protein RecT
MGNLSIYESSKTLQHLSSNESQEFIKKVMKEKAEEFQTFLLSTVASDKALQTCTPSSLMGTFMKAEALGLTLDQTLGCAYCVPYSGQATFQLGYKGYIQLAIRSGMYKKINVVDVREGEIVELDEFTETFKFKAVEKREVVKVIGYYAYFELQNGFCKQIYWSIEKLLEHAKKYSKSFNSPTSPWKTSLDTMCKKTMLRQLISKWGLMSIELQQAYKSDMGVIEFDKNGNEYISYIEPEKVDVEIINQ